jgi:hypothetical protein
MDVPSQTSDGQKTGWRKRMVGNEGSISCASGQLGVAIVYRILNGPADGDRSTNGIR